jgi:hypothetical protein
MARKWTAEEKKAASEKAKARYQERVREAEDNYINAAERVKDVADQIKERREEVSEPTEDKVVEDLGSPDVAALAKMVQDLQKKLAEQEAKQPQTDLAAAIAALAGNQPTGNKKATVDRYDTNLRLYPDIRSRLAAEPRLKRIAFDTNYELGWETAVKRYQTADGTWLKEPQFTLSLNQIVLDDDGEPTARRIGKARMIFFEDPETAVVVAQRLGLPIDEDSSTDFLNEMRYMRAKDWLFECFWPPRSTDGQGNKTQMVIGGQVVDTWEVTAREGQSVKIPFDQLNRA